MTQISPSLEVETRADTAPLPVRLARYGARKHYTPPKKVNLSTRRTRSGGSSAVDLTTGTNGVSVFKQLS